MEMLLIYGPHIEQQSSMGVSRVYKSMQKICLFYSSLVEEENFVSKRLSSLPF